MSDATSFLIGLQSIGKSQEPYVEKLKEPVLIEIVEEIVRRWGLNFKARDVSSMWFLCKQEASSLNTTDQACAIFSPSKTDNWILMTSCTEVLEIDGDSVEALIQIEH